MDLHDSPALIREIGEIQKNARIRSEQHTGALAHAVLPPKLP
jgi:hypothetical protein